LRVGGAAAAGVMVATRPAPSKAAELVLPECSDTIIALRNAAGRQIVVIGTAHISEDSVRLVRSTIRALNPDTVMIELDKKRVGKVNEGKTLKELGFAVPQDQEEGPIVVDGKAGRKNLFMQVVDSVRDSFTSSVQGAAGAVLGKALGQFYNSVEKLGFTAGGEFKAAVEEARTSGATVLLGDRNVDVTLQRLASAISSVDGDRFTALMEKMAAAEDELGLKLDAPGPDGVKKEDLAVFVEGMKQKDSVNKLMGIIRSDVPEIYNALIGERDLYMANSLNGAASQSLMAVVGLAHVNGIEGYLKGFGFQPLALKACPPPKV